MSVVEETETVESEVIEESDELVEEESVDSELEPDLGVEDDSTEPVDEGPPPIDAALLERGKRFGLNAEDFDGLSQEKMDKIFTTLDRGYQQEPEFTATPSKSITQQETPQYEPHKMEFDSELVDESYTKPLMAQHEHMNKQFKEMHDFRQQVISEVNAMGILMEMQQVDHFITSLGDEWTDSYGAGATVNMDPQSATFKDRLAVYRSAKRMMTDEQRNGHLPLPEALKRSHRSKFTEKIIERESKKRTGKSAKRRTQMSDRPAKGKSPTLSPEEEAVAAFAGTS